MRRPLASNEIGWLVRLLLKASDYLNTRCGLDQPPPPEEGRLGYNMKVSFQVFKLCDDMSMFPCEDIGKCLPCFLA